MPLEPEKLRDLTPERIAFIEGQATRCHDFTLESREILGKQAVTTLQWYFGIIVGGSGYLMTLLRSEKPGDPSLAWLIVPIFGAILIAICVAFFLLRKALQARELYPRGNEPKNFATPELAAQDDHWIHCCEVAALQGRIEENMVHNQSVASAVNRARRVLAVLPPGTLILALLWRLIALSLARLS